MGIQQSLSSRRDVRSDLLHFGLMPTHSGIRQLVSGDALDVVQAGSRPAPGSEDIGTRVDGGGLVALPQTILMGSLLRVVGLVETGRTREASRCTTINPSVFDLSSVGAVGSPTWPWTTDAHVRLVPLEPRVVGSERGGEVTSPSRVTAWPKGPCEDRISARGALAPLQRDKPCKGA